MRTQNIVLAAAAALAAGMVTSQAQVYSQNIVGYVNAVFPNATLGVQGNPLDNAAGNYLTNLVSNPSPGGPGNGPLDGTPVYVWGGTSFTTYTIDSNYGGLANAADSAPAAFCPIINPGSAYFINNQSGGLYTNTYVGTVHIGSGSYPGTSTNIIGASAQLALVGSVIPVAGGLTSVLGLTNYDSTGFGSGNGVLNGTPIYFAAYNGAGNFTGFTTITIDDNFPTGYANAADSAGVPEPTVSVAGGFFINNQSGAPIVWIQSLGQ